jgi:hypothetical protein
MKRANTGQLQEESPKKRRLGDASDPDQDPFAWLPDEILDLVFQHNPQPDDTNWLTIFGSVCARWRRMSKQFVRELEIKKPSTYILSDVVSSLPNVASLKLKKPLPTELPSLTTVQKLSLLDFKCPSKMTDQLAQEMTHSMDLIGQITQLAELTLSGPVNDEQIRNLSSLINLEFLNLSEAGIGTLTPTSVSVLQHLTALTGLEMPSSWDTGPALANLTCLEVLNAHIDGINNLADLEGLVNLVEADLSEVEAAHVGHIGAWTNLERLSMNCVHSDDSISRWTSLQRLKYLNLSYSDITPHVLKTVIQCTNLRTIWFEDGAWLDWNVVEEDLLANISRLTKLKSLSDLKHHPVFDNPISHLPDSLKYLEIISDNGQMREQFFANIRHLTNLKTLRFRYTQGGKNALTSAIIEGLAGLTALEKLHIGNDRYNDEFYPIYREMVRMTGPTAVVFLEQYANHTSSFPNVSLAAFSSLTNLRDLQIDLDPFFEDQLMALTTLTKLEKVKFGKYFLTSDFCKLIGRVEAQEDDFIMEFD